MIRYFFRTAFRNFYRNRLYTVISILGLSAGLAISFILFSWIWHELSYDTFHEDHDRIFRVVVMEDEGGGRAAISPALKRLVLNSMADIQSSVRLFAADFLGGKTRVSYGDKVYTNDKIIYADPEFFEVFSFPFVRGNPEVSFNDPGKVIITEKTAKKYFGDTDPVGKDLIISNNVVYEVGGVLDNLPSNSHFHFDILAQLSTFPWGYDIEKIDMGSSWVFNTYFKAYPGNKVEDLEKQLDLSITRHLSDEDAKLYNDVFHVQPISDIHLKSDLNAELEANNDIRYIYLFSTIAFLVIIIAGINYVNLTTAYSFDRAKEVGIKKILGAHKRQLMIQYLGESVLIAILSFILALVLIEILQPLLLFFSGTAISETYHRFGILFLLLGFTILTGLVSGSFPAMITSSFKPIHIFKNQIGKSGSKSGFRKVLVVFQFGISIILLICTGVIFQQLDFIQSKKLGYDKEHVIVLHIGYPDIIGELGHLKSSLLSDTRIKAVSATSQLPSNIITAEYMDVDDKKYPVFYASVDPDFFNLLDINVLMGEEMIKNLVPENFQNRYVISQLTTKEVGWALKEAINKQVRIRHGNMKPGTVIGVVEDINFQSLHHSLNPLVFEFVPEKYEYLLVKVAPSDVNETIEYIKSQWEVIAGGIPFDYSFLDQEYDQLYKSEMSTMRLFIVFAIVAIFIAMMGLFGLSSYAAFKRTKEIGIRKVFGATRLSILGLLSIDFIRLILIAFILSIPVAIYLMNLWLEEFAYKIQINPLLILIAGFVVILLALITVGYHSLDASNTDPAKTLRYE